MKKLIILLTLALSFSFANAKVYPSLKVKDYKSLKIIIENIGKSNSGITEKEITTEVKLILLQNGIKSERKSWDYLYINVNVLPYTDGINDIFYIDIEYRKYASEHKDKIIDSNLTGELFAPDQGIYKTLGIAGNKKFIIETINEKLKLFILDYMESNIE